MKAVVLVGGEGTRLRPLTYSRPKSLAPIMGRPFLEHFLNYLAGHGFDEVILAVSHGRERIEAVFGDGRGFGVSIEYADEPVPLGSAGAVRNVAHLLRDETFLVANGDIFSEIDLTAMLAQHRQKQAWVTIALHRVEDTSGYGVVDIDRDDRIHRFVEKPPTEEAPSRWINAGLWMFEPAALALIPEGHSMVETRLFPDIIAAGERLIGYRSAAYWADIGTSQRYLQVHRDRMEPGALVAEGAILDDAVSVTTPLILAYGARVHAGARLTGPVCFGEGCDIASGAEVMDSVLWEAVRVGSGAIVSGCVIAEDVTIGEGAFVHDAVLGHGTSIAPGVRTPPGLRLNPGERYPPE